MAIATSGPHKKHLPLLLKKLKIASYFSAIVTAEDVKKAKPAPDLFLKAAEELDVNPADCLVLEDAPNGILAAKRAGMIGYGVNKNREVQKELKKAGADGVFSTLTEIKI